MEKPEITDEEDIQSDEETEKEFFDICKSENEKIKAKQIPKFQLNLCYLS